MKFGLEAKVGTFIVLFIILLSILGIFFGKIDFYTDDQYDVSFNIADAFGIKTSSKVYYKGIVVGNLYNIQLDSNNVQLNLKLFNSYQIPNNIVIAIKQSGFVGEKYIELIQSSNFLPTGYLKNGEIYDNRQIKVGIDTVIEKVDDLTSKLSVLVDSVNKVVSKEEGVVALSESIKSIQNIAKGLEKVITINEDVISKIVVNTQSISDSISEILLKNREELDTSIKNMKELTESITNIAALVDKITDNNKENIDKSLANIKILTDELQITLKNINQITSDINDSKGTVGMLINDNETKEDIKLVVQSVKNLTNRVDNYKFYLTFGADYMFDGKSINTARGYADLRLYTKPNTFYLLGVSNTPQIEPTITTTYYNLETLPNNTIIPNGTLSFKSIKEEYSSSKLAFSLQYGHIFYKWFGLRIGIFDSTLGVATDFHFLKDNNLSVAVEAYNFNYNSKFDVYLKSHIRWQFFRNFFIQVGVDDIIGNNNRLYTVGAGVRFADDDIKYFAGSAPYMVK